LTLHLQYSQLKPLTVPPWVAPEKGNRGGRPISRKGQSIMARIFKPTYPKPIPADAKIVNHDGRPHARFKDRDGRSVMAPLTKDGTHVLIEARSSNRCATSRRSSLGSVASRMVTARLL
jgi:hypothetical protein